MKKTIVLSVLSILLLAGCTAMNCISPREQFLQNVASRTTYLKVYEVSPESLRDHEEKVLAATMAIVRGVRDVNQTNQNAAVNAAINEGLARIERISEGLYKERIQLIGKIEQTFDPRTDVVLFFHFWPTDDKQEVGYLVTRCGVPKSKVLLW